MHTHHTEVRPPTHLSVVSRAILASGFSRGGVCDGHGPGRRGSTLMVPRGTGVGGGLCPGTDCPNIRWCPQRVPATWAGPSPRPLQAGAAWTTAPQSPPTVSPAPLFRAPGGGTSRHWPLPPGSQRDRGLGPPQQVAETEAWLFSHVTKWKKSWLVPGRMGMDKPFG